MNNKEKYGEVTTPEEVIKEMYDNSKEYILKYLDENDNINILDVGTGNGIFIKEFIDKFIKNEEKYKNKNIKFAGIEKNEYYESIFKKVLKEDSEYKNYNIEYINDDFIKKENTIENEKYDIIIGNPPFNCDGLIKVPCNKNIKKKNEGRSIWYECIHEANRRLKINGLLLFVSPCLWLKPDKSKTYELLINKNKLLLIKSYSSLECNKIFKYKAQTPVNYFLSRKEKIELEKNNDETKIKIYTKDEEYDFILKKEDAIPTHNIKEVKECIEIMKKNKIGNISKLIKKTNPIGKNIKINDRLEEEYKYKNIKTSKIKKGKKEELENIIEYSDIACPFNNEVKLINSHKRIPNYYYDKEGEYGISTRDNYVITKKNIKEEYGSKLKDDKDINKILNILLLFLNTELIKKILQCTKYRMNYLEKYAYNYVPNIIDYVLKKDLLNEKEEKIIEELLNIKN